MMAGAGIAEAMGNAVMSGWIVGVAVIAIAWGLVELNRDNSIRSNAPITPQIELTVKDNVIDTVYIYEAP